MAPTASIPVEPEKEAVYPVKVFLPENSSTLTASPYDDLDSLAWVDLASETIPKSNDASRANSACFWHVMQQYTRNLHWNRQFFDVSVISESHQSQLPPEKKDPPYIAMRELIRKTPAPIGGGSDGTAPSFVCHEWTKQYTKKVDGTCVCIFALVIPQSILKPDNPFGMTYWPYFYPKTRAIRYTYDPNTATLRYSVVPLGEHMRDIRESRPLEEVLKYAGKSAKKELVTVRKRMANYDPIRRMSTYVKRVVHDTLVEEKDFRAHYNRLRDTYARDWVDSWNDTEVTDPIKYVYEEMAIAAYLLALWSLERANNSSNGDVPHGKKKQRFLDAGCGNGFLVYLLIMEGHPGTGIDLQKRKIWDRYPSNVRDSLRHEEIMADPEKFASSGAQYDWIIGNHSDELTPWLPIFTAASQRPEKNTSSEKIQLHPKLFVLPCCFFDFDARKLAFSNTRRTISVPGKGCSGKYDQYIQWIAQICRAVGFEVAFENLRIPSTKNRAIICTKSIHPERMQPKVLRQLTGLVTLDAKLTRG